VGGQVINPWTWQEQYGFVHGTVVPSGGRTLYVAGQVGWNPVSGEFNTDDFAGQARQALANVVAVLRADGAGPEHLVRLTWYVTSRDEYVAARRALGDAYRAVVGDHYPAMSLLVVSALLEPRAKVEIEATAVVPDGA
jgi:enamine deaminase RidA (YjgF/YER057c/UK114 family)